MSRPVAEFPGDVTAEAPDGAGCHLLVPRDDIGPKNPRRRACESGVEPTRSQKRTVSWRRSPAGTAASGAGVGVDVLVGDATVGSRAPHPPQNFSPGWFTVSHDA